MPLNRRHYELIDLDPGATGFTRGEPLSELVTLAQIRSTIEAAWGTVLLLKLTLEAAMARASGEITSQNAPLIPRIFLSKSKSVSGFAEHYQSLSGERTDLFGNIGEAWFTTNTNIREVNYANFDFEPAFIKLSESIKTTKYMYVNLFEDLSRITVDDYTIFPPVSAEQNAVVDSSGDDSVQANILLAKAKKFMELQWNTNLTAPTLAEFVVIIDDMVELDAYRKGTSKNIRLRRDDRRLRSPRCRFNGRRPFIEAI